ncbi:MAG: pyridoxamine 5'-phosphate oxidase family protein [Candidatus Dormibacteraeota bacterium]|nr:pyridoxamine 5'-phosphate oxidase family protein [Candidatus Dormibacteraeota bacterium]MBV9526127.1 pyridoxamine 5'-phosphate oxidase family protein [Candidatus Dormibacteraeota bacterium]
MAVTGSTDIDRALWALRAYDTTALGTVSANGPHVAGVFFAPERTPSGGIQLLIATIKGSRKQREMAEDPRVAFMCSPGNPSRWVQGTGVADLITDEQRHAELLRRLTSHASGAAQFIERLPVMPALITVRTLKVVEALGTPALLLSFDESGAAG